LAQINEIQMTYKPHCHTKDTYLQMFILCCAIVTLGSSKLNYCMRQ